MTAGVTQRGLTKRAVVTLAELTRAARTALNERVRITIAPDKTVTIEPIQEGAQKVREAPIARKREIGAVRGAGGEV